MLHSHSFGALRHDEVRLCSVHHLSKVVLHIAQASVAVQHTLQTVQLLAYFFIIGPELLRFAKNGCTLLLCFLMGGGLVCSAFTLRHFRAHSARVYEANTLTLGLLLTIDLDVALGG